MRFLDQAEIACVLVGKAWRNRANSGRYEIWRPRNGRLDRSNIAFPLTSSNSLVNREPLRNRKTSIAVVLRELFRKPVVLRAVVHEKCLVGFMFKFSREIEEF